MTSPRDEIDDWLGSEVQPLSPPLGALDRIRRQARRRKTRQAMFAAAGCAVVLGAAVSVPQLVGGNGTGQPNHPIAGTQVPTTVGPSTSHPPSGSVTPTAQGSARIQQQQRSALSTTTSGTVPPRHFRPTSVTFVGNNADGVVGAVLGQAGPPCATRFCTSLAGTSDYGSSWYGVSAPYARGPNGSTGVSQLRFANLRDGWAFGPALYETSGGGWPWTPESTGGQRVIDIEAAAGGPALGLFATCTGTGPDYAANCTGFSLRTSVAGSTTWTPVTLPAGTMSAGQAASASLVVTGTTGYVLTPTSDVLTGPVSGGTWRVAGRAPCAPGPAQASGLPSQALLATSPQQLMVVCAHGSGSLSGTPVLATSVNGSAWRLVGAVPLAGSITSLASGTNGQIVLATTAGIYQSANAGKAWRSAKVIGGAPAGGFSFVGMTNAAKGVALPAESALGVVYVSTDGGLTWQRHAVAG
ncbi:MAG TPA: hypothetical protein VLM11_07085 [Streptosporangiaceae bacterium]|nr:hypothetical protein [Streptosporangiaceae bacterium]